MLSGLSLLLFSCVIFSAAAIKSSLGFAFSIFAMMFLPSLFETYAQAVAVSSLLSCLTSVIVAVKEFRSIRWKVLLPCIAGCFLTSPIAIALSSGLQKDLLIKLLGAFMVLLGIYFIFSGGKFRVRPCLVNGLLTGSLSGFISGLFAVGGPPLVVYFLSSLDSKEEYSATIQTCMACTGFYSTAVRIMNGVFTRELLFTASVGFIAMACGTAVGFLVMKKLPAKHLKTAIYTVMIFSGLKMLLGL